MASTPTIESASAEQLLVKVQTVSDPTGGAVEFQADLASSGRGSPSGSWVAGSWNGTYNATTQRVEALTPTVGVAGSIVVAEGADYHLWMRFGTVVKLAGMFRVR